jgi:hypothetical protein
LVLKLNLMSILARHFKSLLGTLDLAKILSLYPLHIRKAISLEV